MANYLDYFGFKFPAIPQSARKPAQTTAPGTYTGSVGVERPTPPAPQTYRDYMPQQAPRWTPPVEEQSPLPTYRVQSTRQRTAAERMPVAYEPPQVAPMRQVNDMLPPPPTTFPGFNPETMTAMRQVNMLPPPSFDTTTEAPPVPGLRNAVAMPPLAEPAMYLARNLWQNRESALGALDDFPEASQVVADQFGANVREGVAQLPGKIAAGIGKFTSTPVGSVIGAALGGTPEWKANAPTDPRTFWEDVQVAASRGLGGGLWYGALRAFEAGVEPITSGLRVRYLPQDYEQTVAEYKDARDELQRKIVEAQGQIQGRGGDRRALNELRSELADLNRQQQAAYFRSMALGVAQLGIPASGRPVEMKQWFREYMGPVMQEIIDRPHEQKVAERERYREFAPASEQLIVSAILDPLNLLDGIGMFTNAAKIAKAAAREGPAFVGRGAARHVATLDEVGEITNKASDRARSWLGRHTPWQPTPESLAHAHVIDSADTVTRISEVAQDAIKNNPDAIAKLGGLPGENPMVTFLREFIQDPDNPLISTMTGGFSQSLAAKRTVLLMRNIFGTIDETTAAARGAEHAKAAAKLAEVEKRVAAAANKVDELRQAGANTSRIAKAETTASKARQAFEEAKALVDNLPAAPKVGDVDFDEMAKIIAKAKGDDLAAVADLASRYEEAARKIYGMPVKTKGVDGADVLSYKYPSQQSTLRKWRGNVSNAVSMMFLGTNPGYAFRNAANNLFTAMVDGVAPVQSADSLRTLWTRWGPAPWMTKQGVGAQGDVWKTREKAQEYIKSISEPMRLRDVFKAVETATLKDKFSVTLQVGQNFERYASERITAYHIRHYWEQVWPKTVRRITKELSGSFSMEQLHYIEHRLDGCMNPAEVRKVIEDITGAVPPPGSVAGSVPGGPVAPRPVPGGVPGGAPAGAAPTAGRTLDPRMGGAPQDVREGAMQAGGPDAVEAVDDVMRKARTPQEAVARITIREVEAENSTALSLAVESLRADALDALDSKTATVEDLKDYLNRSVEIVRQAQEADTALIKATLKAQEGLDGAARDVLWQETRIARKRSRIAVMGELDQLDNELMPELGFDAKSIRSQSEYRAYVVDTWDKSDRLINNFWRDKRNGLKGATADEIYEAMQKERARLWDDLDQRRNAQIDAFNAEIKRAVGRLNTGDVPPKGASKPPTAGPAAPAAPASDLLPELGGPEIPAGAPTSSTVRYVEPEPAAALPVNIPGDRVQEAMNRAQVISDRWKGKVGGYTDTPEGLEAGGRSGQAIGGTYKEINERRASKKMAVFEAYARRGERGLTKEEIDEINAVWKKLPLEVRDPERYASRQAAKEARLAERLPTAEAQQAPTAPPVAPIAPRPAPKPYESPEIVWEGEPGRMQPTYGIVAPGTQQAQEVLDRIFKRNGMSTSAARIHAATSMRPVWSKLKEYMTATVDDLPPFTPEQAALLRKLANERIIPNMVRDKATVASLATQMRNFALGDYQNKRMIHEWLAYIFPWSYWYTFTYPNWAKRLLTHPSFVSNYARIKAQLAKTNREYYRAVMGDPNAEMPEYWEDQIRVPFHNTQLYFDLERTLIPLQALLNDFDSRTRNEAPGGRVLSDIQEWGPSLHPALTWAYAAWLSSKGYQDASDEWVGYVFPWSRPLKGATALAREHVPGLQKIIPPGGFSVEGALGLKNVEGGDTWERRRIGYALYTLLQEGKITQQQFEDAAYNHSGEAWDMARQREAVKRAPGNLGSYLFGAGFKARDMSDIEIDRMWGDFYKILDARDTSTPEQWSSAWRAFNEKYPFQKAVEMARESDQAERLKDYAYAVMDRLPPGQEYYRMLTEAGLTEEMVDRFKADKGDLSGWKEYEVKAFQAGIEKLAATVGVPTPAQKAEYDQYWQERDTIRAAVEKATGHTYAEYQAANDEYYAEGADKQAVLAKYPWLKAGWDASKSTKATSPTYQKFNPPTSSPTTGKTATATQSELSKKYDEAEKRFGTQVAQWADEYSSLPKTGTARADWKKANPEKYKQVLAYYDYIYGDTRTTTGKASTGKASSSYTSRTPSYSHNYSGGGRYSSGGGSRYTSGGGTPVTTPVDTAPPTPAEAPAYETWTAEDYGELVQEERNDDPAFDTFAGLMFGSDILTLAGQYYNMTPEQRAAWIAANPQLWARLLKYLLWLMKQTGVKSDYTRMMQSIPPNAPNVAPFAPPTSPTVNSWSPVSTPHAPTNVPVAPPVPV